MPFAKIPSETDIDRMKKKNVWLNEISLAMGNVNAPFTVSQNYCL